VLVARYSSKDASASGVLFYANGTGLKGLLAWQKVFYGSVYHEICAIYVFGAIYFALKQVTNRKISVFLLRGRITQKKLDHHALPRGNIGLMMHRQTAHVYADGLSKTGQLTWTLRRQARRKRFTLSQVLTLLAPCC